MQVHHAHGPRFPVQVPIGAEDSLEGYLYRVAEAYSYPAPQNFLRLAGIYGSPRTNPQAVSLLAEITKAPADELARRAHRFDLGPRRNFLGSIISGRHVLLDECRLCPDCLREGRHHSALFDLVWTVACARHGSRLVNSCPDPDCGRRLRWDRHRIDRCECGFDLHDIHAEAASTTSFQFATLLRHAAGFPQIRGGADALQALGWPEDLFDSGIGTVMDLASLIVRHDKRNAGLKAGRQLQMDELHEQFDDVVGDFLADWPIGALAFLRRNRAVRLAAAAKVKNDLGRRFSLPPTTLAYTFRQGIPPFILELRKLHLKECTFSPRHQRELENPTWMTVAQAAKALGISAPLVSRICNEGHLSSTSATPPGSRRNRAIDAVAVARLQVLMAGEIEQKYIRRCHGFTKAIFARIREIGLVKEITPVIPIKRNRHFYRRSDIALLFQTMHSASKVVSALPPLHCKLSSVHYAADAIARILRNRLDCCFIQGGQIDHLDSYFVHFPRTASMRRLGAVEQNGISISQAAKYLRCSARYLKYMIKNRIFVPGPQIDQGSSIRRRGVRFYLDDIVRFQREFVSAREIRECNSEIAGRIACRLDYHLDSVIPKGALSRRQFQLYRRRAIAELCERWGWHMPEIPPLPTIDTVRNLIAHDNG